jgi:uncharacterized protein YecA (UPF0149 family)
MLMGAIADALMEYMRPLTDAMKDTPEGLEKALALGQLCFNLGQMDDDARAEHLGQIRDSMGLSDEEFAGFFRDLILPMLVRHEQMFPREKMMRMPDLIDDFQPDDRLMTKVDKTPHTSPVRRDRNLDRYAPCTCNSGKKYKFCCGAPRR